MAWLEVHQELREHRKLYACADDLNVEPVLMLGMLVSMWLWALDNAQNGSLAGISNRSIARAAKWPEKKADRFVTALIANGWIDQDGDVMALHDWSDYTGRLMDRRAADAARKRKVREDKNRTRAGMDAELSGTSAGRPADNLRISVENPALQYSNSTISPSGDITVPPPPTPSAPPDGDALDAVYGLDGPAAPAIDYGAILTMYNATCTSLPHCRVLSEARKKAIRARIQSGYTPEDFRNLFKKAGSSSFLCGANQRNWTADLDWLIKDANMAKVLDGKYDDREEKHGAGESSDIKDHEYGTYL